MERPVGNDGCHLLGRGVGRACRIAGRVTLGVVHRQQILPPGIEDLDLTVGGLGNLAIQQQPYRAVQCATHTYVTALRLWLDAALPRAAPRGLVRYALADGVGLARHCYRRAMAAALAILGPNEVTDIVRLSGGDAGRRALRNLLNRQAGELRGGGRRHAWLKLVTKCLCHLAGCGGSQLHALQTRGIQDRHDPSAADLDRRQAPFSAPHIGHEAPGQGLWQAIQRHVDRLARYAVRHAEWPLLSLRHEGGERCQRIGGSGDMEAAHKRAAQRVGCRRHRAGVLALRLGELAAACAVQPTARVKATRVDRPPALLLFLYLPRERRQRLPFLERGQRLHHRVVAMLGVFLGQATG